MKWQPIETVPINELVLIFIDGSRGIGRATKSLASSKLRWQISVERGWGIATLGGNWGEPEKWAPYPLPTPPEGEE